MKTLNLIEKRAIEFEDGKISLGFPFFMFMFGALFAYLPTVFVLEPLFGPASILITFLFAPVASYFGSQALFGHEIREINRKREQPHKIIDGFINWKQGDDIDLAHSRRTLKYVGVTDSYNIILAERQSTFNDEFKRLSSVPPLYVARYLNENESLQRRFDKKRDRKFRNSDSEYEEYLKTLKQSLNEIENNAERVHPRRKRLN